MSDQNVNQPESSGSGSKQSSQTTQTRKPRTGRERLIVWGAIGILLVLLLLEARARIGYSSTLEALKKATVDNEAEGKRLTLDQFREIASAAPSISKSEDSSSSGLVNCEWFSVFKKYRIELTVRSEDGEEYVVTFDTPGAPQEKIIPLSELTEEQKKLLATADTLSMAPGPGAGAPKKGKGKGGGKTGKKGQDSPDRQRPGGNLLSRLSEESVQAELGLTDEQKQKIEDLRDKYPVDVEQLREKSREEREAFFQERRKNVEAELNAIFNEKQQEIWKSLSNQSEEKSSKTDSPE